MGKNIGDMNHMGLVAAVAIEAGVSRDVAARVLRATLDVVGRTVANGHHVTVTNFGTWARKVIRGTRNPQTGEPGGPTATVTFRPTGKLSEWVKSGSAEAADTLAKSPKGGASHG